MENVPCPMRDTEACPIFVQEGQCYEDQHHVYWPSPDYASRTEKAFRQLDINKVEICRWLHNTLHSITIPPEMPSPAVMRRAIEAERSNRA